MIEVSSDIPFLWRLSPESNEGYCTVAMVIPCPPETDIDDVTIETSVQSLASDNTRSEQEETLEWNQEDLHLFLQLVNRNQESDEFATENNIRIDLSDPDIIEIVNVVAAAGFGVAFTSYGLLKERAESYPVHSFDIGSPVSLDTINGFKSCVVVDVDDDDVVCVLLEDLEVALSDELESLSRHDLMLVKRSDVLQPDFANSTRVPMGATIH